MAMINIHGTELNYGDTENIMFKIDFCLESYCPISFQLCMMIVMTKLYILVPV